MIEENNYISQSNENEKKSFDQIDELISLLTSSKQDSKCKTKQKFSSYFWTILKKLPSYFCALLTMISWNATMFYTYWDYLAYPFCVQDGSENMNVHILFNFTLYCLLLPIMYWRSIRILKFKFIKFSAKEYLRRLRIISWETFMISSFKFLFLTGIVLEVSWLMSCTELGVEVPYWTPILRLGCALLLPVFSSIVLCPIISSLTEYYSIFTWELEKKIHQTWEEVGLKCNWKEKELKRLINYRGKKLQEAFLLLNDGLTQHIFSVNFIVFIFIIAASFNRLEYGTGLLLLIIPTIALGIMAYICIHCAQVSLEWDRLNQLLFQKQVEIMKALLMHHNKEISNFGLEEQASEETDLETRAETLRCLMDEISKDPPYFQLYGDIKINFGFFMTACGFILTFNNIIRALNIASDIGIYLFA